MGVRTEQAYVGWIRRYIHFQNVRHPDEMGAVEVVEFLSRLAVERNVSASTQNQAAWTRIKVLQRIWPQHAPNLV